MKSRSSSRAVLHILGRWRPGGVTRLVKSIVGRNRASDTRHDILVTLPAKDEDSIPQIDDCTVFRLDFSWPHAPSSLRRARRIMSSYDAVMIHAAHPVVVLPLLLDRLPSLFFQHGMSVSGGPRHKRAIKKLWLSMVPRLVGARVVCSTPFALEKAGALGIRIREREAVIVPFGVEPTRDVIPLKRAHRERGVITLGVAARLVAQKRLDLPLKALTQYSGSTRLRLLIAGEGPQRSELEGMAATRHPQVEIRFLGQISNMVSFYDSLDLVVVPSRGESFGLVVLEAFDRGVPVAVFPDVGGCLSLVKDGMNGFVMDNGVEGFRKLLTRLDDEPVLLRRMSDWLMERDLSEYSVEKTRSILEGLVFRPPMRMTESSRDDDSVPENACAV